MSSRSWRQIYFSRGSIPFWTIHLLAIAGVAYYGWSWSGFALAIGFYYARMFFITGAYHRYFSHRTYKTSRPVQLAFAVLAQTSAQKGALWWASHHRWHHKYSDMPEDVHSAKLRGFWWSHVGWILSSDWSKTDYERVGDLAKYPELRFLNRPFMQLVPAVALGIACALVGGMHGLLWAFFVSTVLLWHGTFTINSLSHMFGNRRYQTTDESKNNWLLALVTLGEGWHNNHHHYQSSANQGFRWWEIDITYYGLKLLSWTGLIWDVRRAPDHVVFPKPEATPDVAGALPVAPAAAESAQVG